MNTGAGVGIRLVLGRPIWQKNLGHAKYHLESDTDTRVSDSAKNFGHRCPGNTEKLVNKCSNRA